MHLALYMYIQVLKILKNFFKNIVSILGIEAVKTSRDERPNDDDVGFSSIIYKVSGIPSGIYLVRRTNSSSSLNI